MEERQNKGKYSIFTTFAFTLKFLYGIEEMGEAVA
jgi:hypothetical protein